MVGKGSSSSSRGRSAGSSDRDPRLADIVFSWSFEDIFDESLYRYQVDEIPGRFGSVEQYLGSFIYPLLEETRAELRATMESISTLPYARVTACEHKKSSYEIKVDRWRNGSNKQGNKGPHKILPNDLLIIANLKPETVADLQRIGTWAFGSVTRITSGNSSVRVQVAVENKLGGTNLNNKQLFVISTFNLTTYGRIWSGLHMTCNWNVVKGILCTDSAEKECGVCPTQIDLCNDNLGRNMLNDLNNFQAEAVVTCLRKSRCKHRPGVELIWGPPGTGKTKATATLLLSLLSMKCRTVVCAPTNVAVVEVATRVVKLLKGSASSGEVLLFGNKERLKVEDPDVEEICLDDRVEKIAEFSALLRRCKHLLCRAIDFLGSCSYQYRVSLTKSSEDESAPEFLKKRLMSAVEPLERLRKKFSSTMKPLEGCLSRLCTHKYADHFLKHNHRDVSELLGKLTSFGASISRKNLNKLSRGRLEEVISVHVKKGECFGALESVRNCLQRMKLLYPKNMEKIRKLCFQSAILIFCTASNTSKLHDVRMEPVKLLVIDEAAQLKECESVIPLQLPGVEHAILIGDECQLPSVVKSNVSDGAHFGRSLFERLSSMGKVKHPLNVQYRMHPSISCFPNRTFYSGLIQDGPNVIHDNYTKRYLPLKMFGPYAFISVPDGREDCEANGHSLRNLVEADVAAQILSNVHKAWSLSSKEELSVGIISPYAAQIHAISERVGRKYELSDGFTVTVNTVDGFQGREQDIIILSTVRSKSRGQIGFLANLNRTNVALTRARYALWILGNQRTLQASSTVWQALLYDAIDRHCFFNAEDNEVLARTIIEAKIKYNQLDDLLARGSPLYGNARSKVIFTENFCQSFRKLKSPQTKSSMMELLMKASSGWRPRRNLDLICPNSSMIVKNFKVGNLYVLYTVDIEKELDYIQIMKIWDVFPLEDIAKIIKGLDGIYSTFSDEYICRCKEESFEGDLQVPVSWQTPVEFLHQEGSSSANSKGAFDCQNSMDHLKVEEDLLLMKFRSLSLGTSKHSFVDRDGDII